MVHLAALWLPILLAAIAVFVVSSVVHMVLQLHKQEYRKLPDEDAVMALLRQQGAAAGEYIMPCCSSMEEMRSPEMVQKRKLGPVGVVILRGGDVSLGKSLGQWFLYSIVIGVMVAYLTGLACAPGAPFHTVFRFASAAATLGYGFSSVTNSIWKGVPWRTTATFFVDGVLYGLATGAMFGWLWPAAA